MWVDMGVFLADITEFITFNITSCKGMITGKFKGILGEESFYRYKNRWGWLLFQYSHLGFLRKRNLLLGQLAFLMLQTNLR